MSKATTVEEWLAQQGEKAWLPKPENDRPGVPRDAKQAERRFYCTALKCEMAGKDCASRFVSCDPKHAHDFARGRFEYNRRVGKCIECPAGAARAELLGVSREDVEQSAQERVKRGRRRFNRSLSDRVQANNEHADEMYGADREERHRRRLDVELARKGQKR